MSPAPRPRRLLAFFGAAAGVVLALLLGAQVWTWLFPPTIAASGAAIRVLLDGDPLSLRIDGAALRCEPAPDFEITGPLEIRVQSKGLLVLAGGRPWVLDEADLRVSWEGRASLLMERATGTSESSQIGSMHIQRQEATLRAILHTDLEVYLTGVVEAEMGPRFPAAALEAQAIAARSFAWSARERRRRRAWDVRANTADQVFRGPSEHPAVVRAVRATLGEYVLWDGRPLRAYYASTCGGRTRQGKERFRDVPASPLASVACGFCRASPLWRWRRVAPADRLGELGLEAGEATLEIEPVRRSERGDWISFRLRRQGGAWTELPVQRLRRIVNLPSPWITRARPGGTGVVLEGRGFGHGVGLCQFGAAGMANDGRTSRQILTHYYPGTEIGPLEP